MGGTNTETKKSPLKTMQDPEYDDGTTEKWTLVEGGGKW